MKSTAWEMRNAAPAPERHAVAMRGVVAARSQHRIARGDRRSHFSAAIEPKRAVLAGEQAVTELEVEPNTASRARLRDNTRPEGELPTCKGEFVTRRQAKAHDGREPEGLLLCAQQAHLAVQDHRPDTLVGVAAVFRVVVLPWDGDVRSVGENDGQLRAHYRPVLDAPVEAQDAGEVVVDQVLRTLRVSGADRVVVDEALERHQVERAVEHEAEAVVVVPEDVGSVDGRDALGVDRVTGTAVGRSRRCPSAAAPTPRRPWPPRRRLGLRTQSGVYAPPNLGPCSTFPTRSSGRSFHSNQRNHNPTGTSVGRQTPLTPAGSSGLPTTQPGGRPTEFDPGHAWHSHNGCASATSRCGR